MNASKLSKGKRRVESEELLRVCTGCGKPMVGQRGTYDYVECGLTSVKLTNVLIFECECGAKVPEIPAIEALHQIIALDLLRKDSLLSPEEVRFLRKMSGLTQSELAQMMGVDRTRPSKWESSESTIGKESDRLLRSCFLLGIMQQHTNDEDPVAETLAAAKFIRQVDVKEIFKKISQKQKGSKPLSIERNTDSKRGNDAWRLPETKAPMHVQ